VTPPLFEVPPTLAAADDTTLTISIQLSESSSVAYVVVPHEAPTPNVSQVSRRR
jgi:hypothetical protein